MKTLLISCLSGISLMLASCQKRTETMLDQLKVEPIVNPNTGVLLRGNLLMTAQLEMDGTISGMTDKQAFETHDQFNSFTHTFLPSGPIKQDHIQVNGHLFFYPSQGSTLPVLNCSQDYGRTWNIFTPVITGAGIDYWNICDYNYQNPTTLFMLGTRGEYSSWYDTTKYNAVLYKVNPTTQAGEVVANIENYMARGMHFFNDEVGWMILSKSIRKSYNYFETTNTYVAHTIDGGRSWSEPVLVNGKNIYKLAAGSDQNVFLYTGPTINYEESGYFSRDGGSTWQMSNNTYYYFDVEYIAARTLIAITQVGLMKSTDDGETWTAIQQSNTVLNANRLHFINEMKGIAYLQSDRVLSITNDGGLTWKRLLYPFSYVIE